jgi:hypothetical protein
MAWRWRYAGERPRQTQAPPAKGQTARTHPLVALMYDFRHPEARKILRCRWAALYFIRYTTPGGAERRIKVGNPRTMVLGEARVAAKSMLAKAYSGGAPAGAHAAARAAWTTREAWIEHEASSEFAKKVSRSQAGDRATAQLHPAPYRRGQAGGHRCASRPPAASGCRRRPARQLPHVLRKRGSRRATPLVRPLASARGRALGSCFRGNDDRGGNDNCNGNGNCRANRRRLNRVRPRRWGAPSSSRARPRCSGCPG